jgi:hypothetical protein
MPLKAENAGELTVTTCDPDLEDLDSELVVSLSLSSSVTLLESQEFDELVESLKVLVSETYNSMLEGYCDPLHRQIDKFNLLSTQSAKQGFQVESCLDYGFTFGVKGKCRGCGVGTPMFHEDGSGTRRALDESSLGGFFARDGRRRLEDLELCVCDKTAALDRAPTRGEFETELEEVLNGSNLNHACDLVPFSCDAGITNFTKLTTVELKFVCEEEAPTTDDPRMIAIAKTFLLTYNSLESRFCDPYFRTLTGAEIVRVGNLREGDNLPIEVLTTGNCRGCDSSGVDIFELPTYSTSSDRSLLEGLTSDVESRRLQDVETCWCSSQAVKRAPFESEFIEAYQSSIANLTLDCIGTVGECLFGTTFDTEIVIAFDEDGFTKHYVPAVSRKSSRRRSTHFIGTMKNQAIGSFEWLRM